MYTRMCASSFIIKTTYKAGHNIFLEVWNELEYVKKMYM